MSDKCRCCKGTVVNDGGKLCVLCYEKMLGLIRRLAKSASPYKEKCGCISCEAIRIVREVDFGKDEVTG